MLLGLQLWPGSIPVCQGHQRHHPAVARHQGTSLTGPSPISKGYPNTSLSVDGVPKILCRQAGPPILTSITHLQPLQTDIRCPPKQKPSGEFRRTPQFHSPLAYAVMMVQAHDWATPPVHIGAISRFALQAGSVFVNTPGAVDDTTPFGGYKESGIGRDKGEAALHHYTITKTIYQACTPSLRSLESFCLPGQPRL